MFLNMSYIDPTHRDPATRKFKSGSESRANPYSRIKCAALRVPVCKHAYVPLFNIPPFLHSYLFEHPDLMSRFSGRDCESTNRRCRVQMLISLTCPDIEQRTLKGFKVRDRTDTDS